MLCPAPSETAARTAGRTMRRLDCALLLPAMRRVPRVPRAQGHTRRKHGRESLQPLVIDEVRQGWFGAACVALGGGCAQASFWPSLGPAPGVMCGCRPVWNLCGPPWSEDLQLHVLCEIATRMSHVYSDEGRSCVAGLRATAHSALAVINTRQPKKLHQETVEEDRAWRLKPTCYGQHNPSSV